MRNLDIGALRSLVAIADTEGVTTAAKRVNLTQSAVSMQIKRLEEMFESELLHRRGRGVVLTNAGDQLVGYARRLLALNDETWTRLTTKQFEGELRFGVPFDIVHPHVPNVLRAFTRAYPRVNISINSSLTAILKRQLTDGQCDLILTTEQQVGKGGETLADVELRWLGAAGGKAHLKRPLPVALRRECALKPAMALALDKADIPWVTVGDVDSEMAVSAILSADLAVTPVGGSQLPQDCEFIDAPALPEIGRFLINMYHNDAGQPELVACLAKMVRHHYRDQISV